MGSSGASDIGGRVFGVRDDVGGSWDDITGGGACEQELGRKLRHRSLTTIVDMILETHVLFQAFISYVDPEREQNY